MPLQVDNSSPCANIGSMFHKAKTLAFAFLLFGFAAFTTFSASAAVTVIPPNSTTAPVIFIFDTAADLEQDFSTAFINMTSYAVYYPTLSWSAGNTVLTATPTSPWPSSGSVTYMLMGDDIDGFPIYVSDTFSVVGGGGETGTGTNQFTNFQLGIAHNYNQTSTGIPTLDTTIPFMFGSMVILASNRTANSVTMTLPNGTSSNLTRNPLFPEIYAFTYSTTVSNTLNTTFPAGNYTNTIIATASNQSVRLVLTNASAQPPVPHITNYTAAQNVDPTQPFTLGWDTFVGGTTNDFIDLNISAAFDSPGYSMPGMLRGTSNTIVIPAGTLQPNSNYIANLGFYRVIMATNGSSAAMSYRATITEFSFITTGPAAPVLTNRTYNSGIFNFDVISSLGSTVTVQWSTNLPNWNNLVVTNFNGVTNRHITDSQSAGKPYRFYRARTGS
jgi:hypothetical protein